jgi:transposase
MAKPLLTDELWQRIEPLLPLEPPKPKGGRPRVPDRAALTGILFILRTGAQWEYLPQEMGCGCGMTCWRRLRDWHKAGVWQRIWQLVLDELGLADNIDWSRALLDSSSVRAVLGGRRPVRIPRIVGKQAANATSSPTPKGRRWPSSTPGPTATTATWPSR